MSLNIQHLENEIIDQYLYDENPTRPWIIGFSGGKDSTMLLQPANKSSKNTATITSFFTQKKN